MPSRRRGLRAVDDPTETGTGGRKTEQPAPRKSDRRSARRQKTGHERRITIYAEATEEDRRALTITAAMLDAEKGDVVRALVREFASESPSSRQLDALRELIAKHA